MPAARRFVEVRFDPVGALAAAQSGAQAGSTVDAIVASFGGGPARAGYRGVAIARGVPEPQVARILAGLAAAGGHAQVLVRVPGRCVFRYELDAAAVPGPARGVLLAFAAELGDPWIRVAGGEVMLRAEAGPGAEAAVRNLRKALAVAGVSADVRAVELPGAELGPWLEAHGVLEALQEQGALDASRLPTTVTPGTP